MNPRRRRVLKATVTGAIVGLAGCTGSVPGVGGSSDDPCSAATSLREAAWYGEAETAAEYVPYEYEDVMTREEAVGAYDVDELGEAFQELLELDDVRCESETALDDDDPDVEFLESEVFGGHEITDAYEVEIVRTISGEHPIRGDLDGDEERGTWIMVEIDGDGWYVVDQYL
ncbi:hypothetical protein [Halovivax gelatinilyticus]|uniref:hypothetical protein n=1 Tax=Halovivax gelatinilyticus TaxID=2961597 RepID=UPI0020CA46FE|nr:hypothetical protein [Halovivax gelatinilyticus]